jgi:hypothetical protein
MTHDELLAKIEDDFDYDSVNHKFQYALRAVVELHSYIIYKNTETDEMYEQCHECSGNGYHALYPCPTIRAIEKELA